MTTRRWTWSGALVLTLLGLTAQEALSFRGIYLGESEREIVVTAIGWACWVAAPYALALLLLIIARRHSAARLLSMTAALVVAGMGLAFSTVALTDTSADPLVGLVWLLAPLVQLGAGIGFAVAIVVLLVRDRSRQPPAAGPVASEPRLTSGQR